MQSVLIWFLLMFSALFSATYYVKPAGSDTLDGLSSGNAKLTLQNAIDCASPSDTVLVAEGIYKTNTGLTNNGTYGVLINKTNLVIKGGYDVTFASQTGYSVLNSDGAMNYTMQVTGQNCRIDGFLFSGDTNSSTTLAAVTLDSSGSNTILSNCIVSNNSVTGIKISSQSNKILNVTSGWNFQHVYASAIGMDLLGNGNLVKNCTFSYNKTTNTGNSGTGGISVSGSYNWLENVNCHENEGGQRGGATIGGTYNIITNIVVSRNTYKYSSTWKAAGLYAAGTRNYIHGIICSNYGNDAGGILVYGTTNTINAVIFSNYGSQGGGIQIGYCNGTIITGIISNNRASQGAGIYFYLVGLSYHSHTLSNALVVNNYATSAGGGAYIYGGSNVVIQYCTITNNSSPSAQEAPIITGGTITNASIINNTLGGTNNSSQYGIIETSNLSNHIIKGNFFMAETLGYLYRNNNGAITALSGITILNTPGHSNHGADVAESNWGYFYPVITPSVQSCTTNTAFTLTLAVSADYGYLSDAGISGPYARFSSPSTNLSISSNITFYYFSSNAIAVSITNSLVFNFTAQTLSNTNLFTDAAALLTKANSWNLSGVPLAPSAGEITSLFPEVSGNAVFIWDAQNQNYSASGVLSAGRGFWLNPANSGNLSISGTAAGQFTAIGIKLFSGWNLISSPFLFFCKYLNIASGADGQNSESWEAGANSGSVDRRIWGYDSLQEAYYITDTLEPWKGYWVWSKEEKYLYIKGNDQTNNLKARCLFNPELSAHNTGSGEWQAQFIFSAGGKRDSLNVLGTRKGALDEVDNHDSRKTPAGPSGSPRLCIDNNLSYSIKSPVTGIKSWKLTLENNEPYIDCELSWNCTQAFDCGLFCMLAESGSGKIIKADTVGTYKITAGNSGVRQEYIFTAARDDYRYILENRIGIRDAKGGSLYRIQNDYLLLGFLPQPGVNGETRMCTADGRKLWEMKWHAEPGETYIEKKVPVKNLNSGPYILLITYKNPLTGQRVTFRKMIVLFR